MQSMIFQLKSRKMSNRVYSQPKPVRPYQRFPPMKSAMTGIDPEGNFKNFIKRDPTTNIDVRRDRKFETRHEDHVKIPVGQVPFGTTKCTYKKGLSTDGRLKREDHGIMTKSFPRNPTDNISSDPPAQERPFQGLFDKMVSTSKYDKNSPSSNPWLPKELKH